MSDAKSTTILLSQAREGGVAAVNELIAKTRPWIRRQAELLIGNGNPRIDASDVAQEVCLRATINFGEFRGREFGHLLAWLSSILRHYLIDAGRYDKAAIRDKAKESPFDSRFHVVDDQQLTAEERALRDETLLQVVSAVDVLPRHQQDIIRYRFFEQLSFREIASIVGKTEKHCGVICVRAIKRLRKELGDHA
jgi:RNA polymerase sigma-70 factor (ECF subfamily)